MQGHSGINKEANKCPHQDKVVSIFSARHKAEATALSQTTAAEEPSFDDVMRKNAENLDRIRRERLQANKGVLKSYRIKD